MRSRSSNFLIQRSLKETDTERRTVKPFGDKGAHIVLPFKWIGKDVIVTIKDNELEILAVTT